MIEALRILTNPPTPRCALVLPPYFVKQFTTYCLNSQPQINATSCLLRRTGTPPTTPNAISSANKNPDLHYRGLRLLGPSGLEFCCLRIGALFVDFQLADEVELLIYFSRLLFSFCAYIPFMHFAVSLQLKIEVESKSPALFCVSESFLEDVIQKRTKT